MYNYDVLGVLPVIPFFKGLFFNYFINMIASHCCLMDLCKRLKIKRSSTQPSESTSVRASPMSIEYISHKKWYVMFSSQLLNQLRV